MQYKSIFIVEWVMSLMRETESGIRHGNEDSRGMRIENHGGGGGGGGRKFP